MSWTPCGCFSQPRTDRERQDFQDCLAISGGPEPVLSADLLGIPRSPGRDGHETALDLARGADLRRLLHRFSVSARWFVSSGSVWLGSGRSSTIPWLSLRGFPIPFTDAAAHKSALHWLLLDNGTSTQRLDSPSSSLPGQFSPHCFGRPAGSAGLPRGRGEIVD